MPEPPKPEASKLLTVDERVGLDRFDFDEEPFITVDTDVCRTCDTKPCLYVCPSKVYRLDKGELVYNTEGCIDVCRTCDTKPCLYVCPSKVYRLDKGELVYNTEGCIELGACAIVCKHLGKNAIHWNYPRGSYGVEFRFG